MNARELRAKLDEIKKKALAIVNAAEKEDRDFKPEEQTEYDGYMAEISSLENRIKRAESLPEASVLNGRAPAVLTFPRGDSERRALGAFFKRGDLGAVRDLRVQDDDRDFMDGIEIHVPSMLEQRAVDSTMNITTAADGGAAVPTGFAGQIAMRRNDIRLAERLGVRPIPGVGTTVNFPVENADPTVFAATSEQADNYANTYERDVAPVLVNKAFTLAKKTKKLALTEELLDDEDANLLNYVGDSIGRGLALTHNTALLTEVAANGTALKTFASATAIAADEVDAIIFTSALAPYLDDLATISWVMRPNVLGEIKVLTGTTRLYDNSTGGPKFSLLEYPVNYSAACTETVASSKSVYFGNWYYVGMRENPALRIIRDPYTTDGIVYLKYAVRLCYGVLIAGAIGYGVHPSA